MEECRERLEAAAAVQGTGALSGKQSQPLVSGFPWDARAMGVHHPAAAVPWSAAVTATPAAPTPPPWRPSRRSVDSWVVTQAESVPSIVRLY